MTPTALHTIPAAARILGVSERTIHRRIHAGTLPAFRDGRIIRIRDTDLSAYIEAHTTKPPPPRQRPPVTTPRRLNTTTTTRTGEKVRVTRLWDRPEARTP